MEQTQGAGHWCRKFQAPAGKRHFASKAPARPVFWRSAPRGLIAQRQKAGVSSETGPNAILLCDSPIQKGCFTNLSEFPVLQMLYRQGMIIPGHPNNTGRKPMLIGLEDQVRSQAQYIFRGNYGLASAEELTACGVPLGVPGSRGVRGSGPQPGGGGGIPGALRSRFPHRAPGVLLRDSHRRGGRVEP